MKRQNCISCMFSSWYNSFKRVSFESRIIKLPVEFVAYLKCDGIILPETNTPRYSNELERYSDDDDDANQDGGGWNVDEGNESSPNFPELKEEVEKAISDLGKVKYLVQLMSVVVPGSF